MNKEAPKQIYITQFAHGKLDSFWDSEALPFKAGKAIKYVRADWIKKKVEKMLAHCGIDDAGDACRAVIEEGKELLKELEKEKIND